jgi:hypothetical protein
VAEDLGGVGFSAPGRHRLTIRSISWKGQAVDVNMLTRGEGLIWALGQTVAPITGAVLTVVTMIDPRTGHIVDEHQLPGTDGAVFTAKRLYLGDLEHGRIYRLTRGGTVQALTVPRSEATLATATPGKLWATTRTRPGRLITISLDASGARNTGH